MDGIPEARRGPRASRWRHLRSWLFGEPERFRDERQRLWGAYAAWLGEQVQQRLGEDAETAPRLLAFLESRRAAGQLPNTDIDLRVWARRTRLDRPSRLPAQRRRADRE